MVGHFFRLAVENRAVALVKVKLLRACGEVAVVCEGRDVVGEESCERFSIKSVSGTYQPIKQLYRIS